VRVSRIYLVRHAEAAGHEEGDPGLSVTGREQVSALAAALRHRDVAAVWHGPRRRTAETATVLGELLGVSDVEATPLLDDRTPVPGPDRRADYPRHRWPWFDAVPADERDEDGHAMTAAWQELRERARDTDVVMVTHAFVVSWFVAQALAAPPFAWTRLPAANASLTVIGCDDQGGPVVECVNQTHHLGPHGA
jgi:probable phosphoglycerate mutase